MTCHGFKWQPGEQVTSAWDGRGQYLNAHPQENNACIRDFFGVFPSLGGEAALRFPWHVEHELEETPPISFATWRSSPIRMGNTLRIPSHLSSDLFQTSSFQIPPSISSLLLSFKGISSHPTVQQRKKIAVQKKNVVKITNELNEWNPTSTAKQWL